jgi:predicted GNAT superfamily acetyltransferase
MRAVMKCIPWAALMLTQGDRMHDQELQPFGLADLALAKPLGNALLALNNVHAQELSWLEPERLAHLVERAFLARMIGNLDAFLLAFDQDAEYDSPNFLWFRARYPRFVYVDRIVVASSARGRGCARRLYLDLFEQAVLAGTRSHRLRSQHPAAESGIGRIPCRIGFRRGRSRQHPSGQQDGALFVTFTWYADRHLNASLILIASLRLPLTREGSASVPSSAYSKAALSASKASLSGGKSSLTAFQIIEASMRW